MNTWIQTFATVIAVAIMTGAALGQVKSDQPIKTTLCELVKEPKHFDGKMVQIRAAILTGVDLPNDDSRPVSELSLLSDNRCAERIWFARTDIMNGQLTSPTGSSIVVRQDDEYRKMNDFSSRSYVPKNGPPVAVFINCPLFLVISTVTGRFDYIKKAVQEHSRIVSGFGTLNSYDSQLVLQSVSDVVAKPIDPSRYEERK